MLLSEHRYVENAAHPQEPSSALEGWLASHARASLWVCWAFYLAVATTITLGVNTPLHGDAKYFVDIATSVANGDGFMERYLFAYRPPGYPAWLSIAMVLGLDQPVGLKLFMVVTMSATVPICWLLCRDTFGPSAASVGAALAAGSPWFVRLPDLMFSEGLFLPLFALLLWLVNRCLTGPSFARFAVAGAVCGITALVREVVYYLPLLLLFTFVVTRFKASWRQRLVFLAVFAACEALAIAPWTLRNYTVFDRPIPISTNPWINIYIGNNPTHDNVHEFHWTIPEGVPWNKRPQPDGQDELVAMDTCKRDAVRYIKQAPLAFVQRAAAKMWKFVTPHFGLVSQQTSRIVAISLLADLVLYCVLVCSSLWYVVRSISTLRTQPNLVFCLAYAAYSVVVAGITYSNSRYRLPFVMVALVLATPGLVSLLSLRWLTARLESKAPSEQG